MSVLEHSGSLVFRTFKDGDPLPSTLREEPPIAVVRASDEAIIDKDAGLKIIDPLEHPQAVNSLGWASLKQAS